MNDFSASGTGPDDASTRLRRSMDARGPAPELSDAIVANAATRGAPRMVNRQRTLRIASGLTLAAAAVTVASLVVTSTLPREPLFTAAGSAGATAALGTGEGMSSSDMRIGMYIDYRYEPGAGLSRDGGTGSVYQLRRTGSAESRLTDVARTLGLSGAPAKASYFDPAYPTWTIGPEDGTAPSVVITWAGTGNWWYNDPTATPQYVCGATPLEGETTEGAAPDAAAPDQIVIDPPVCESQPVEPSENFAPSESDARRLAHDLFAATGLDVPAESIRVTADEWQTTATASLTVDGTETAIDWSVGWSTSGKISFAYGHSIEVVDRGSFDTVSATDAVGRLADWRWYGAAGPEYQGGAYIMAANGLFDVTVSSGGSAQPRDSLDPEAPSEAVNEPTAEPAPAPSTDAGIEPMPSGDPGSEPGAEPTTEPAPQPAPDPEPTVVEPEPLPTPEVVVVTVDEADATLLLMWDADGNAWLVPGFAMQHPDGWFMSVVSLAEGIIELPAPIDVQPMVGVDTTEVRVEE